MPLKKGQEGCPRKVSLVKLRLSKDYIHSTRKKGELNLQYRRNTQGHLHILTLTPSPRNRKKTPPENLNNKSGRFVV